MSLNSTCNRLSTQYLNLIRTTSSVVALETGQPDPRGRSSAVSHCEITRQNKRMGDTKSEHRLIPLLYSFLYVRLFVPSYVASCPNSVGGGRMTSLQDPPPPPLAADVAVSSLQCQLAVENICVATSQLLGLIRTLRLSILLMDEDTIQAEEEWQAQQARAAANRSLQRAQQVEQELLKLRNGEATPSK